MSDTAWQVGSALAIIGPAAGFMLGRLTSGLKDQIAINAMNIAYIDELLDRLRVRGQELASARAENYVLTRKADKYDAQQEANRERHIARLKREAEEAAKRAETHASLAAIVEASNA